MRKIFVIGIGAGNPDYITVQAINALNEVDVFFVLDKGREKEDLLRLRKDICERYVKNRSYRTVEARDPERDRASSSYEAAVKAWHGQRAAVYERLIRDELICGAERMDGAADRMDMDGAARMAGADPMDRPIEPPPPPPMDRPIEGPPPPPPPPPPARPRCWASALLATTDAITRHSAPIGRLFVSIG